jgi:X-X-X-Leu-X-X-Gly heptad repeat protein
MISTASTYLSSIKTYFNNINTNFTSAQTIYNNIHDIFNLCTYGNRVTKSIGSQIHDIVSIPSESYSDIISNINTKLSLIISYNDDSYSIYTNVSSIKNVASSIYASPNILTNNNLQTVQTYFNHITNDYNSIILLNDSVNTKLTTLNGVYTNANNAYTDINNLLNQLKDKSNQLKDNLNELKSFFHL